MNGKISLNVLLLVYIAAKNNSSIAFNHKIDYHKKDHSSILVKNFADRCMYDVDIETTYKTDHLLNLHFNTMLFL